MKKRLVIIQCIIIVILSFSVSAQTKSKFIDNPNLPDSLEGYRKAKKEELGKPGQQLALNIMEISAYNEKMDKIETSEFLQKMMQGGFGMTPYVNTKMEVKAIVLGELTESEKTTINTTAEPLKIRSQKSNLLGKPMPELNSITDINGTQWTNENLKGKVVAINFWFEACKPCILEIPELNKIVEKYKDKDVVFLAFALDKKEEVQSFLTKREFKYHQIPDAKGLKDKFEVSGFPSHIVVDKKGVVQFTTMGLSNRTVSMIEENIKKYL